MSISRALRDKIGAGRLMEEFLRKNAPLSYYSDPVKEEAGREERRIRAAFGYASTNLGGGLSLNGAARTARARLGAGR